MWYVCFVGTNTYGVQTFNVVGPFSSQGAAQSYATSNGLNPLTNVTQVYSTPGSSPPTPIAPPAGNWVVAQAYTNLLGVSSYNVFGNFATLAAATGQILSMTYPNGTIAAQVVSPS